SSFVTRSEIRSSAPYTICSATDFLPLRMTMLMNLASISLPYFGSGRTWRRGAWLRLDISRSYSTRRCGVVRSKGRSPSSIISLTCSRRRLPASAFHFGGSGLGLGAPKPDSGWCFLTPSHDRVGAPDPVATPQQSSASAALSVLVLGLCGHPCVTRAPDDAFGSQWPSKKGV